MYTIYTMYLNNNISKLLIVFVSNRLEIKGYPWKLIFCKELAMYLELFE